jgi:hypothetical protein
VSLEGLNPKPPPPGFTDSRVIISFRGKFRVHTSCGGGSLIFVITASSRYLKTKKKNQRNTLGPLVFGKNRDQRTVGSKPPNFLKNRWFSRWLFGFFKKIMITMVT